MPNVYVMGASIQTGGAFMAYHIGRILHKQFGYTPVDVQTQPPAPERLFTYDTSMPAVSVKQMSDSITEDDLLVANPSFSEHMFGLRLPGRKISYLQDFRTYDYLDCHGDLYVSVSTLVQEFVRNIYQLETPVIPPFIQLKRLPEPQPWQERPFGSVIVYQKNDRPAHRIAGQTLQHLLREALPQLQVTFLHSRQLPQAELFALLGSSRYFINLCIAEGFGLLPLEAMALGCTVLGLDGAAGRDYLRFEHNSMAVPFIDFHKIPAILRFLVEHPSQAEALAAQGRKDATLYSYGAFRDGWNTLLTTFLEQK